MTDSDIIITGVDRDSTDAGIQAGRDLWLADQIEAGAQSIERGE